MLLTRGGGVAGSLATARFLAYCYSTDQVGQAVYIMGNKVGAHFQVTHVNITSWNTMPAIGIIVQKNTSTECVVQYRDQVAGIYSGLTPGGTLWIGTDGFLTEIPPTAPPGGFVIRQPMGRCLSASELLLWVQEPIKRLSN